MRTPFSAGWHAKTGSDLKKAEKDDKDFKNLGLNPALPNSGSTKSKMKIVQFT